MADWTLAVPAAVWQELLVALDRPEETAGVLLAGVCQDQAAPALLASEVLWVPDEAYAVREPLRLEIRSEGWVPALKYAADQQRTAIFVHTHPGGDPAPSHHDDAVDETIGRVFARRTRSDRYASFILGGTPDEPAFSGRINGEAISRVRVVGNGRLRIVRNPGIGTAGGGGAFDRQVRAFGQAGQAALGDLRVGVVGAGGTGSAVIEQLARLGVGSLTLVDPDVVTASNLTRIYGSGEADVGLPKVDVAADAVRRLGFGTETRAFQASVNQRAGMEPLRRCDLVFGCTDDNAGRVVLSRMSYFYEQPLIDMGVVITSADGLINGIFGRVTIAGLGEPCLICRGRVDLALARDETMRPEERTRLAEEGYARGLDDPDPAVIAYTTAVAAAAVNEFLDLVIGFGESDVQRELLLRILDRSTSRVAGSPAPGHFCEDHLRWGRGDVEPALDMIWP